MPSTSFDSTLGGIAGTALGGPLGGLAGSGLGALLGGLFGNTGGYGTGSSFSPQGNNLVGSINPVGVSNTAPLLYGAAKQAGQEESSAVANRYGTLGLGNSTMASVDESAAKSQPMIQAASGVMQYDLDAQKFNSNLDLAAQEFNAKAAQQYQQQNAALDAQLQSLLFSGNQSPTGGPGVGGGVVLGSTPGTTQFTPGGLQDAGTPIGTGGWA